MLTLKAIQDAVLKTKPLLLTAQELHIEVKPGHGNYVTDIDGKVQALLKKELSGLLPGSAFIGEEQSNQPLGEDWTWIVDPIDGTANFIKKRRASAVSVGLYHNAQPVMACVYQPYADELFTAEKGKGAWMNGQPIHVSSVSLSQAMVGMGTAPYVDALHAPSMRLALKYLDAAADIRRCGSAALDLADVACGRYDVFYELSLCPWDYAAGVLLVTEAGGTVYMPWNDRLDYSRPTALLAANGVCDAEALAIFNTEKRP